MSAAWELIDAFLTGRGIRYGAPTLEQTTGGTHEPDSWHYKGTARDYGRATSDVGAITSALLPFATGDNAPIVELFDSSSNVFMKEGHAFVPSTELRRDHWDHAHVALAPGATLDDVVSSTSSGSKSSVLLAGLPGLLLHVVVVTAGVGLLGLGIYQAAAGGKA